MLIQTLITWLVSLTTVYSSSSSKSMKMFPTISHSVVNLGKIDVSLNFYRDNPDPIYKKEEDQTKPEVIVDLPCPCADDHLSKTFSPNPLKILRSDDLFEESTSSLCCDFHQQKHQDVALMDIGRRKKIFKNNRNPFIKPFSQLLLETMPNTKFGSQLKPNAIEIFLFPKKKDIANFESIKTITNKIIPNEDIQVIGDKPLHNEIQSISQAITSVTKNLKDTKTEKQIDKEVISNTSKINNTSNSTSENNI